MSQLDHGDGIILGTSMQIKVNGNEVWVKVEVSTRVRENESDEQTAIRLDKFLQNQLLEQIESTAQNIMRYEEKRS